MGGLKDLRWVRWVSDFDMEPLVGAILRVGSFVGSGLVLLGLIWSWRATGHLGLVGPLTAETVLRFLLSGVRHAELLRTTPVGLIRLGLAVLLLVPYVRVIVSAWYFEVVERQRLYALLSALTVLLLTYVLVVF